MAKVSEEVVDYLTAGIRELAGLKQAFFFLIIVGMIAIPVSSLAAGGVWYWYKYSLYVLVGAFLEVFFIQIILLKYRAVVINKRSIFLCVIWYVAAVLIELAVSKLSFSALMPILSFIPAFEVYRQQQYYILSVLGYCISLLISWPIWLYPFFVLEGFQDPIRRSFRLVKRHYFSLALISVILWCPKIIITHFLAQQVIQKMHYVTDRQSYAEYRYLFYFMRLEFSAMWAIAAAIMTVVYLKITTPKTKSLKA